MNQTVCACAPRSHPTSLCKPATHHCVEVMLSRHADWVDCTFLFFVNCDRDLLVCVTFIIAVVYKLYIVELLDISSCIAIFFINMMFITLLMMIII